MPEKVITEGTTVPTQESDGKPEKPDGRKRRWKEHKIARREELVDGTLSAIRNRGSKIGMDEIAAEIGVSKTVLYRYFTDKSDLTKATMMRYVQTILAPNIYSAMGGQLGEFELVRSAVSAYVHTVADDPDIYLYVMSSGSSHEVVADSERMFAELVATVLADRARLLEIDSGGAVPWAYSIVGSIQLATHWWISNKAMTAEDLIDYLTMMTWGAVEGIARAGGSPAKFRAREHPMPTPES